MSPRYKYLFEPEQSRLPGRSLRVHVTPFKTCFFNCIYCPYDDITHGDSIRSEFVPLEEVCAELETWLSENGTAEIIAFTDSGEPTLYSRLGEVIAFIKSKTEIPVLVLSNGALLHRQLVRDELMTADVVKIILSAWDDSSFTKIHRPATDLSFPRLLAGIRDFRRLYRGRLWLETFLIEGVNSSPDQVQRISAVAAEIRPDKIILNTAARLPSTPPMLPVTEEHLHSFSKLFTPTAEVITSF